MLYSSVDNKKIKEIKKLNVKKYRDELGLFLVEGEHLVCEAKNAGILCELLLLDGEKFNLDVETNYVSLNVMKSISNLDNPPKMIGICRKNISDKIIGDKVLILDDIQDPGNLGTIIRSSVAFNIDTIVVSPNTVDIYNSKVIRATQGMIFNINFVVMDIGECVNYLKKNDFHIFGTKVTGGKKLKTIDKFLKFAIIMGNEGNGVHNEYLELCDEYIYIPMNSACESLNVGVATSIILYEFDK